MEPAILAVLAVPLQRRLGSVPRLGRLDCSHPLLFALILEHPADLVPGLQKRGMPACAAQIGVKIFMLADEALHEGEEDVSEVRVELRAASAANFGERAID